jgi:hypothetical protein
MQTQIISGEDPQNYTPGQAGAAFSTQVRRLMREENLSIEAAWQKAKLLFPKLHGRLCEKVGEADALPNAAPAIPAGNSKKFYLPLLRLPPDTTDTEFAAAFKANGMKAAPLQAAKVLTALVILTAREQKTTPADAREICQKRFSILATLADGDASALGNAESPVDQYHREFKTALGKCGNDPVKAHATVMKIPGLAQRIRAKA